MLATDVQYTLNDEDLDGIGEQWYWNTESDFGGPFDTHAGAKEDYSEYIEDLLQQPEIVRLPDDNALTGQEQASGTDVLPSDCSGCPLDRAAHKGDYVSVELTQAELDWLRIVILCSHMRTSDPAIANRVYDKLEELSK